jgi:hypothetical protein
MVTDSETLVIVRRTQFTESAGGSYARLLLVSMFIVFEISGICG